MSMGPYCTSMCLQFYTKVLYESDTQKNTSNNRVWYEQDNLEQWVGHPMTVAVLQCSYKCLLHPKGNGLQPVVLQL